MTIIAALRPWGVVQSSRDPYRSTCGLPVARPGLNDRPLVRNDTFKSEWPFLAIMLLAPWCALRAGDAPTSSDHGAKPIIKPAISTQSGLLLEPPLDLTQFTREIGRAHV